MKLSNFTQGRDNNFNVIRIAAALAVLITHSFALAIGSGDAEPLRESLGMTLGSIAVDVFFVTSGFLVTASLLTRQSTVEFIWARILRIYPALIVMLLLTVFGVGVFFTNWPLSIYLADSRTYIYLLKCSTLIAGAAYNLPGVFEGNPYKYAVNGSLWTMPYELRMYAILAIVWFALRITESARMKTFKLAIVIAAGVAGLAVLVLHFSLATEMFFLKLFFMFFTGAAFYVLRERITLSPSVFWLFVVALCISGAADKHAFFVVYSFTVAYILFFLAYIPSGNIRKYNQLGDYSYGLYIYAFPVQQSVAALIPGISVLAMALISTAVALILAVLSWHCLERRALGLKGAYVKHTKTMLAYGLKATSNHPHKPRW